MNLTEALQKQIQFCEQYAHYKCRVFVVSNIGRDIVMKVISSILPIPNRVDLRASRNEATATFPNGSIIRIMAADSRAKGYRYNGQIIDNNISKDVINCYIAPYLMLRNLESNALKRETADDALSRVYYTSISWDDVAELRQCSALNFLNNLKQGIEEKIQTGNFRREYECMFINDCDRPLFDRDLNDKRVLLYNAWGIPEDNITYETEFINKTKQPYLKIEGEYVIDDMDIERKLNVRLPIDTEIYDGFGVTVSDGMVRVELYEIENEKPELKDFSA